MNIAYMDVISLPEATQDHLHVYMNIAYMDVISLPEATQDHLH